MYRTAFAITFLVLGSITLLARSAEASLNPNTRDARVIMQAVFDRDTGDRAIGRSLMTIVDSNGTRKRVMQTQALEFTGGIKTLILFESPADVRNTGLLSFDYDDGSKQDDQWLYLPSLRKSTRISTGGKSGAFVGSDLTYSDLTQVDPKQYKLRLLKADVDVDGESCWLIELRPATAKIKKETGYLKSHFWVSKEKLLVVQAKAWIEEGKKLKYTRMSDIKKVDDIWTVYSILARTVQGKKVESTTKVQILDIKYNDDAVTADDFSERRLERGI
ncbi:MAG: outer membrane lipoprotein-sorting protein [Myxococcota bacterium]